LQPALDAYGDVLSANEQWTYAYFVKQGRKPVKVAGFEMEKIEDVFNLDVDKDESKEVIIINSSEINTYTGTCKVGPWYSVHVFTQTSTGFAYNSRVSRWFGGGVNLAEGNAAPDMETCDGDKLIYVFPHKTRADIEKTLATSPFLSLMTGDAPLFATVIRKSWLYESSTVATQTKKYLIAGDRVVVTDVVADLCSIIYIGGKKPLKIWIKCDALKPTSGNVD
jgi:hypothetical protein